MVKQLGYIGASIATLAVVAGILSVLFMLAGNGGVSEKDFALPVLMVVGSISLIGLLAAIGVIYAFFNLDDRTQAMALPEGSIRAVLAMLLLLLFAILSVYLYDTIASNDMIKISGIPQVELGKVEGTKIATYPDGKETYTVMLKRDKNVDGTDFAKQLFTTLSILVTSISSFYFGSKTGADAAAAKVAGDKKMKPKISCVDPSTIAKSDNPTVLTISGDNLNAVNAVSLDGDNYKLVASKVLSANSSVRAEFTFNDPPAGLKTVKVTVTDANGNADTFQAPLTINQ